MPSLTALFFSNPRNLIISASLLRVALLIYGRHMDSRASITGVKYTDIDYLVFTDAANFLSQKRSPYERATYRYTPLLAWLLHPTTWTTRTISHAIWFEFGKVLFAASDILTGWMILKVLVRWKGMSLERAGKYASLWLLNPMVANISTRGSSEGLVAVVVIAMLWAVLERKVAVAGLLLGLGVHLKIYPFMYAASMAWWLGNRGKENQKGNSDERQVGLFGKIKKLVTWERLDLAQNSFSAFMALNVVMYFMYGEPFLEHSYTYHLTRIDHRHNFSVYNTALHLSSLRALSDSFRVESLAFIPQLFLSVLAIPFMLAKKDLASTMLAQTFAFVTFNKVCTSQYFLWYMVFLPFYLPDSSLMRKPVLGVSALVLWVAGQAFWLQQGYALEFLGQSTFVPGLWVASMLFFLINCWILGIIVADVASQPEDLAGATPVDELDGKKAQ